MGWILKGFCLQSLQSRLLDQKFFSSATTLNLIKSFHISSATTLNLIKSFCMMLKKQQESITRCTLQFLQISQHCHKYYFLKLYTDGRLVYDSQTNFPLGNRFHRLKVGPIQTSKFCY